MEKLTCSISEITSSIEDLIKEGANVPVYVSGSSMNPFLVSRRDLVWLCACEEGDYKRGKIILFKRNDNSLVLHRIKKLLPDGRLLVNGDAQTWCETVKKNQVIAVVSEIQRKGKIKSADSLSYRFANLIWQLLMPFRTLIMRVWFKLRRCKNKK